LEAIIVTPLLPTIGALDVARVLFHGSVCWRSCRRSPGL